MQAYSKPDRKDDDYALPDIEVFYFDGDWEPDEWSAPGIFDEFSDEPAPRGWYWWTCLPGCLPEGNPTGPFETEEEALKDAQNS